MWSLGAGRAPGGFSDWEEGEASAKAAWPGASLLLFPGLSPQLLCPQGSPDCRRQCEPDYYRDRDGRCTACVSCAGGESLDLPPGVAAREQGVGDLSGEAEDRGVWSPEVPSLVF